MIPSSDSLKIKKILVILDVNKNPFSLTSHRERDDNYFDDDASSNNEENDEMKFSHLSETTKSGLMSLEILFQGQSQTVADLIGKTTDNMLDKVFGCFAIEELLHLAEEKLNEEKSIKIPSCDTSRFEQSLYIKRKKRFPFNGQFELGGKCKISQEGHIEWLVINEEKKKEAWKEVMGLINQANSTNKIVKDNDLTNLKEKRKEKSTVIISGVAGSGKSTILSHYYEKIKRTKSDHWIIRINLVDRCEELMKVNHFTRSDVINFCINHLHVVNEKSSFSRSLLRNRLEKGDRIIFMFDGFDEINSSCQEKAIQLMKAITKETAAQLFVTTRPHMADDLQFQLSQLAYNLENFTEKDQIDYLIKFWIKELNLSNNKNELLQQFAKSLVERVSETLKDEEKSFVGIPLQCRILAECYHSNVKELIKTLNSKANGEELHGSEEHLKELLSNQKFDIISLYELLITTKRKVFLKEKANATNANQIVSGAIGRLINDVEDHLTKLAITLFVEDKDKVHILWPPHPHQSKENKVKEEKANTKYGYAFGLTTKDYKGKETFLHRTYAEYYFAKFLFEGFKLDEKNITNFSKMKPLEILSWSTYSQNNESNGNIITAYVSF
jgi:REP element-mobilizing transposase RayT